jgi:hypothetical protein
MGFSPGKTEMAKRLRNSKPSNRTMDRTRSGGLRPPPRAGHRDRYAHRVGREGEACDTWRREGILAEPGNSVWVGSCESRQASQTHPEIIWDRGPYSSQRRRSP